ncbi:hypothetical protein [Burkholderia cenocepacia]|uniref:hypothetical protein n=1 Tax=Burkholderia cenocepacia TaxID=95486 RepID=UPI001BAD4E9B|nr:hypothetical protein [Burkholderia cenocepacia]
MPVGYFYFYKIEIPANVYECNCRPLWKRVFPLRKRFVWTNACKLAPVRLESVILPPPVAAKIGVAVAFMAADIQCHIE